MPGTAEKPVRHWFVTGASGGLGRAIVAHALAEGDVVTATARNPAALDDLRGERLTVERLDVTDRAAVEAVVARTIPVDIVVNNAGYGLIGATEEMTVEQIRDQVETLLIAPMLITRAFLGPMREQGGGRIIQVSSMGGQIGSSMWTAYHAGKWGLEGFTEGVSREVAEFGIRFTIVEPGGTRTGFVSALRSTVETGTYRDTAVGRERRALAAAGEGALTGDPAKLAAAVHATTRQAEPPLRLTLGADAYDAVHAALTERLAALEAQKELAASVAFSDPDPGRP